METPKTLMEAIKTFSDPTVAHEYIVSLRWPNGVQCPHCLKATGEIHGRVSFLSTRRIWKCKECKKQFSVKSGTIMEDSPLGLDKWLTALWLLVSAKNGISSYELARSLGIKQQSAWFLLHRLRHMLETGSMEKMTGTIEVDETFVGGKSKNMHTDRRAEQRAKGFPKITVLGMRQREGEVRTMVVSNREQATLHGQIEENVEEGATVYTDSWKSYNGLANKFNHGIIDHNVGQYVSGDISTNGMENYWTILKRAYHGTYVHISDWHADKYLAEEDFRFNSRKQKDGERFAEAVSKMAGKRLTYAELTESHLVNLAPK